MHNRDTNFSCKKENIIDSFTSQKLGLMGRLYNQEAMAQEEIYILMD